MKAIKEIEMVECETCGGCGEVHSHNPICWTCHGSGKVPKSENDARIKREVEVALDNQKKETVRWGWSDLNSSEKEQILMIVAKAEKRAERRKKRRAKMGKF
jgi:DnaJ-class molecular chaperone